MTPISRTRGHVLVASMILLPALLAAAVPAAAQSLEPLTLRVSDAIAAPDGLAAVVLRTYSSRPVGQGQLDWLATCQFSAPLVKGASLRQAERQAPLACLGGGSTELGPYLVGHIVFSSNGDVQSTVITPRENPEALILQFLSPTASVNDLDGPLAVLFLRLPPEATPGSAIDLSLDAGGTLLLDGDGNPIPIDIRPGVLRVRAQQDPRLLVADGDKVRAGQTAELEIQTLEPFGLAAGHVVLHYDPAFAAGPPQVRFDSRYGRGSFTADVSTPGTVVVDFESPDGLINRIPGGFIQIRLPTEPSLPVGARSPLILDRKQSWLQPHGFGGGLIEVELVDGELLIRE